jgi:inorganic phosphate transporter, PiT family
MLTFTLVLIIIFALIYNLANGWNDAAGAIATVISTRVLSPTKAIIFGSVLNFCGALFSSEVAKTVGAEIASPEQLTLSTFLAAVMMAPLWINFCARRGLPTSCSHALLGALIGSVIAAAGVDALKAHGIQKILFGVMICPPAGFILGNTLARLVTWAFKDINPKTGSVIFGKLQLLSAGAMAFAHGTGDAQKAMGIISGALMVKMLQENVSTLSYAPNFVIPFWVRIACALTMALGTSVGGWAVMRTLGSRLVHLRRYQGFSAETAAATTILLNTMGGIPISTTHSITGAILGVGAARGVKMVRWGIGKKIVYAWIVTFPVCIIGGAVIHKLLMLSGLR